MDVFNHIILGGIVSDVTGWSFLFVVLLSLMPDIPVLVGVFVIGKLHDRFLWFALDKDWERGYEKYPWIESWYHLFHSFLSLPLYVFLCWLFHQSIFLGVVTFFVHIVFDIFTHKGKWSIRPLYPLSQKSISGLINLWSLGWKNAFLVNILLLLLWFLLSVYF